VFHDSDLHDTALKPVVSEGVFWKESVWSFVYLRKLM